MSIRHFVVSCFVVSYYVVSHFVTVPTFSIGPSRDSCNFPQLGNVVYPHCLNHLQLPGSLEPNTSVGLPERDSTLAGSHWRWCVSLGLLELQRENYITWNSMDVRCCWFDDIFRTESIIPLLDFLVTGRFSQIFWFLFFLIDFHAYEQIFHYHKTSFGYEEICQIAILKFTSIIIPITLAITITIYNVDKENWSLKKLINWPKIIVNPDPSNQTRSDSFTKRKKRKNGSYCFDCPRYQLFKWRQIVYFVLKK